VHAVCDFKLHLESPFFELNQVGWVNFFRGVDLRRVLEEDYCWSVFERTFKQIDWPFAVEWVLAIKWSRLRKLKHILLHLT